MSHPKADSERRVSRSLKKPSKSAVAAKVKSRLPSGSQLLALEARMLFDGAALASHDLVVDKSPADASFKAEAEKSIDAQRLSTQGAVSGARELLVVDSNVQGWQQLASGRAANVDLLVVEAGQDGVSAIAAALFGKQGYTAIHVISHGADGQVFLGNRAINADTLAQRAGEFANIGQALDRDADIMLYGCDLASSRAGMEFLQALAKATSADVAASVDKTGSAALGGNWVLEASVGSIEARNPIAQTELIRFDDLLTNTAGTLEFTKAIVQDNVADAPGPGTPTSFPVVYLTNNPQSRFQAAGDASANPLTQTINTALIESSSLEADIKNVDAGDFVRVALILRNTGSSPLYDLCLNDDIPAGLEIVPGQDNLRIVRGDGTPVDVTDALGNPATINTLIRSLGGNGTVFHLVDPSGSTQPLLTAKDPAAGAQGTDVVIITYDARVKSNVVAGSSQSSTANVFGYALSENGPQVPSSAVSDTAFVEIAQPTIDKNLVATNRTFTTGTNVVIGEVLTYEVTLKVPEGVTTGATFTDTLPAGMMFVDLEPITTSAGVTVAGGDPTLGVQASSFNGNPASQFTLNFGDITNANSDNAINDTITIRYRAVVRDVVSNQSGTTLTNDVRFGAITDATLPSVTVVEPAVSINMTSNVTSAAIGDCITYTVTVTSNGQSPAFDVSLSDVLPAGLTFVPGSFTQVSGPAPDQALAFTGSAVTGTWNQLNVGTSSTFSFQACINNTVTLGATIDHNAEARFSSLPGDIAGPITTDPNATKNISTYSSGGGAQERTGADGVGGALDDYAVRDGAPVTVITSLTAQMYIVESSLSSTGTRNAYLGTGTFSDTATVGEVVRYRMVVQVPEANMANFKIDTALPNGIRFINDGSATLALVSDNAATFTSSTISDAALNKPDGGTPSAPINVAGIKPNYRIAGSAIQNSGGTALAAGVQASGADICFVLGDLNNADGDTDKEYVVIEFNAVISNDTANQSHSNLTGAAGTPVDLTASFLARFTGDSAASNVVTERVIEPVITDLTKTVSSPAGAVSDPNLPTRITYTVTFTNSGTSTAYDVQVQDLISTIPGLTLVPASVSGQPGGSTVQTTGNDLLVTIPSLAPNASVTLTYQVDVASGTAFASDPVTVRYSSLENTVGDKLNVSVSQGGSSVGIFSISDQERGSSSGQVADAAGLNNYMDMATLGLGTISGCLWKDVSSPNNNVFNVGTDSPLNGLRVELRSAGPDGILGNADDVLREVLTQTVNGKSGCYVFTGLPAGDYQITVPTTHTDPTLGRVRNEFDLGVSGPQGDGIILTTLGAGTNRTNQDFGYRQVNDPPVANPDTNGTSNTPGASATGNVIRPVAPGDRTDTDPENDPLVVCGVAAGNNPGGLPISTGVNTAIVGANNYGTVTIQADGSYVFNVNAANPTVSGLAAGATLQEVFSYTVCDPAGNKSSTTLTITITGTNVVTPLPPDSRDKTFNIPEDAAFPIPVGSIFFSDPNPGDSLKAVIIDTLPDARLGALLLGTTPVTAGQSIPAAQLSNLVFQPVQDMNRSTYPAGATDPQFTFRVCDQTGLTDPTPNKLVFIIDPVNDNPNPYPPLTRCFDQTGGAQAMDNASQAGQTLLPAPTDKDNQASDLRVVITALPVSGQFTVNGTPITVGQSLTIAQWQALSFAPNNGFTGTPDANGVINGGKLSFNVTDGAGGSTPSELNVCLKPNALPPNTPPSYSDQTRCFDQLGGAQGMDNASEVGQTKLPLPSDKEQAAQDLRITINALPNSGIFSLDGKPLTVGQVLTPEQWQRIQFTPDPNSKGPTPASGVAPTVIDGGKLAFTVSDGKGGAVSNTLSVCLKPAVLKPPVEPPKPSQEPPIVPPRVVPPEVTPIPLTNPGPQGERLRQLIDDKVNALSDLDAGNLFDSNRITGLFGDEVLGPLRQKAVADNRAEVLDPVPPPVVPKNQAVKRAVADCDAPKPKAKAKPRAVQRMVFTDKIAKPSVGFSEQLKDAQKKFKAPAKVTPKVAKADC